MIKLLLLSLVVAAPSGASKLVDLGNQSFLEGNLKQARRQYRAAYAKSKNPKIFVNIGETYWQEDRLAKAIDYFERFLRVTNNKELPVAKELKRRVDAYHANASKAKPTKKKRVRRKRSLARKADPAAELPEVSVPIPSDTTAAFSPDRLENQEILDDPVYKTWWFWTVSGLAIAGAGAAIYFAAQPDDLAIGELGNSRVSSWETF